MATIAGTITGVRFVSESPTGKTNDRVYEVTASFAAYTGASDSATVLAIPTAVQNATRNGKTFTLRYAMPAAAGVDTNAQDVYAGAMTVSTNDLTFNLAVAAGTEITSATASTGVRFLVMGQEA